MCNTQRGLAGAECRDICSQGQMILSFAVLEIIGGLAGAIACAYAAQRKPGRSPRQVIFVPLLILAWCGTFGFSVNGMRTACNTVGFHDFSLVTESSGRMIRRSPQVLDDASFITYCISGCFSTSALVVLPLAWVSF